MATDLDIEQFRSLVNSHRDGLSPELRTVNRAIHDRPEPTYKEFFAHDTLSSFLEKHGFEVKRKAYGLDTSFEATAGSGGRQVVSCVRRVRCPAGHRPPEDIAAAIMAHPGIHPPRQPLRHRHRMNWYVRSPTTGRGEKLQQQVKACMEAAAVATGCKANYIPAATYEHIISNQALSRTCVEDMGKLGEKVMVKLGGAFSASTDMGNVSHMVPGFHGAFGIQTEPDVALHSRGFAAAAGTNEAHEVAMKSGEGMAMLALRVLVDDGVATEVKQHFDEKA